MATVYKVKNKQDGEISVYKAAGEKELRNYLTDKLYEISRCSHDDVVSMLGEADITVVPEQEKKSRKVIDDKTLPLPFEDESTK